MTTKPLFLDQVAWPPLELASVGAACLIVSDLQRTLDFYAGAIGLDVLSLTAESAQLAWL